MSMYPMILSQDQFCHREALTYPYEERGIQFGDGIYEVIRIYNGDFYLLPEHINRLFRSASAIKIDLPFTKERFTHLLLELLNRNNMLDDGKLYMQVTRGSAPRDHGFPNNITPNFYAYIQDLPRNIPQLQKGVSVITTSDIRWEHCFIKSLNLLPNVLAKQEAKENGCFEAVLHKDGMITEGSSSNIYLVKNGCIYTHPATKRILHGCVRMRVEQFAKNLNIPFIEEGFSVSHLTSADELFLTSSVTEITPIIKVDGKTITNGKPGPITKKLQQAYEQDAQITPK